MKTQDKVQRWLIQALEEPLTKIMSENSHLTKIQLETLLIDILAENLSEKDLKKEEKAKMRFSRSAVSRGAFNRTLKQARKNVIQSVYTILLLGYLGVLETPSLDVYLELSNHLESYMVEYRKAWERFKKGMTDEERLKMITLMRKELESALEELSRPGKLSK